MATETLTFDRQLDELVAPYPGEWVLIDILEEDETNTVPTRMQVIGHSFDRDEVYALDRELDRRTMIVYSLLPEEKDRIVIV